MRRRAVPSTSRGVTSSSTQTFLEDTIPPTNKGVYYGEFEKPVVDNIVRQKKPSRNELLVKVHSVGLNPVDAKHVVGDKLQYHWTTARRLAHRFLVQNTRVGFDFSGIVAQDHPKYPQGTKVFGTMPPLKGSCGEYICVPLHQVAKASDKLSLEESAALPLVGLTAWQSLSPFIVRDTSKVLVIGGSGGTGHVALQVAKALGAPVVATVCSTKNVDYVKQCGATDVIDYTKSSDITQELIPLGPFDVILDCVTSADPDDAKHNYPNRIRNTPGVSTQHHIYQRLGGQWSDWIRAGLARPKIFPHSWLWTDPRERLFWIRFPHSSHELEELAQFANKGQLKPNIQHVYDGLSAVSVQHTFEDILSRRVQGKIVVRVSPEETDKS